MGNACLHYGHDAGAEYQNRNRARVDHDLLPGLERSCVITKEKLSIVIEQKAVGVVELRITCAEWEKKTESSKLEEGQTMSGLQFAVLTVMKIQS